MDSFDILILRQVKAESVELLTLVVASCWAPRHTGSRCEEPAPMCSAVQGRVSAFGPADPGQ